MTTTRRKAGFFIQIYGSSLEPFIKSYAPQPLCNSKKNPVRRTGFVYFTP